MPIDPEKEMPLGEPGEIALRGPAVAKGYWNLPDATREVFRPDGWFLTGDIGILDADGILCITDRKKDMIIMSGWKIYPTEVENLLIQHPAIADVAVFGLPDERKGEYPVVAVVLKPGASLGEDEFSTLVPRPHGRLQDPPEDDGSGCPPPGPWLETAPEGPPGKVRRIVLLIRFGVIFCDKIPGSSGNLISDQLNISH